MVPSYSIPEVCDSQPEVLTDFLMSTISQIWAFILLFLSQKHSSAEGLYLQDRNLRELSPAELFTFTKMAVTNEEKVLLETTAHHWVYSDI